MKKISVKISFILSLLCILFLTSILCVNAAEIKLNYLYRVVGTGNREYEEWLVDEFNQRYEGSIKVEAVGVDNDVYKSKIITMLRGSSPPDVFFSWEGGYAKFLVDAGIVEPLDKYYEQYNWDEFLTKAGVNLSIINGKKYFVPTLMCASVVWYQTDIFKEHNLSVPKNWEELMTNASVLKENGIAPFILANQKRWPAQFFWSAVFVNKYGVDIYDNLMDREIPWTDHRVVETFEIMKKMVDDGMILEGMNSLDVYPAMVPFSKGQAAMWYQGSFLIPQFVQSDLQLDVFPFPSIGDVDPTVEVFANWTVMMNSSSKYKEEAAKFIDFMVSSEVQEKLVEKYGPYPTNKNIDISNLSYVERKIGEIVAEAGYTFMHPDHALPSAVSDPYLDQLQGVLIGQITPADAAKAIEEVANKQQGPVK